MKVLRSWPLLRTKAQHTFEVCEWLGDVVSLENSDRASTLWGMNQFFKIYRSKKSWLDDTDLALLSRARDAMVFSFRNCAWQAQIDKTSLYRMIPKFHVVDDSYWDTMDSKWNAGKDMTFRDEESMRFFRQINLKLHPKNSGRGLQRWVLQFSTEVFGISGKT